MVPSTIATPARLHIASLFACCTTTFTSRGVPSGCVVLQRLCGRPSHCSSEVFRSSVTSSHLGSRRAHRQGFRVDRLLALCWWSVSTSQPHHAFADRPVCMTGGAVCPVWTPFHVSVPHADHAVSTWMFTETIVFTCREIHLEETRRRTSVEVVVDMLTHQGDTLKCVLRLVGQDSRASRRDVVERSSRQTESTT